VQLSFLYVNTLTVHTKDIKFKRNAQCTVMQSIFERLVVSCNFMSGIFSQPVMVMIRFRSLYRVWWLRGYAHVYLLLSIERYPLIQHAKFSRRLLHVKDYCNCVESPHMQDDTKRKPDCCRCVEFTANKGDFDEKSSSAPAPTTSRSAHVHVVLVNNRKVVVFLTF